MAYNVLTGSIFRIPSSSLTITGAFAGDGGELTNLPIQTTSDAAATRIITFTNGIGNAVQGEENLTFNGSLLSVAGNVTASINVSASGFYGDGQNLTNLPAAAISSYTNAADNRIITSVNSSTVNAEGNLTFNSASSLLTVGGASHLSGGVAHKRIAVINDYGVTLADYYLGVDTTSNTVKLTLPAASSAQVGQTFVIKDEGANTEANPITVSGSGADTIDGETQVQIESPYGALSLYTNGSHWFIY
jgi:hypothetical protein